MQISLSALFGAYDEIRLRPGVDQQAGGGLLRRAFDDVDVVGDDDNEEGGKLIRHLLLKEFLSFLCHPAVRELDLDVEVREKDIRCICRLLAGH